MTSCPCCSGLNYDKCCRPYLEGEKPAPTALALMRSRYTAYARRDTDYITRTWATNYRQDVDWVDLAKWCHDVSFVGLTIIDTVKGERQDDTGVIEFIARYQQAAEVQELHERSRFVKTDGHWYYSCEEPAVGKETALKVSRNAPCPCGSGKKHKKCCLID